MGNKWNFITGDVDWADYGGEWMRVKEDRVEYLKFINLKEHDPNFSCTYTVQLYEMKVNDILHCDYLEQAKSFCDLERMGEDPTIYDLTSAVLAYGGNEFLTREKSGNNYNKLLTEMGITTKLKAY
jgi:hypothetical protein